MSSVNTKIELKNFIENDKDTINVPFGMKRGYLETNQDNDNDNDKDTENIIRGFIIDNAFRSGINSDLFYQQQVSRMAYLDYLIKGGISYDCDDGSK